MLRQNWKTWPYWRWWWRERVPRDAKVVVVLALIALLLLGGYFASARLTGASAASNAKSYILQTTVTKIVTLHKNGKTIVKRVPVVIRRTVVRSSTAFATVVDTRVITKPGGVHYVLRKVLHYVPVVKQRIIREHGKTTTLTETRLVPTVKTQTQTLTNVVTNEQTVTNTVDRTTTLPVTTVKTVTQPVTVTETHTVTQTETQTQTQTQTQTETETQTVTETVPVTTTVVVTTTAGP
jgi:hypothetical protein